MRAWLADGALATDLRLSPTHWRRSEYHYIRGTRFAAEGSMAASATPLLPMWYRTLAVIVGVFSIALALIVLVEPLLALWLLIFFLALALMLMGVDRLAAGISGHPVGGMFTLMGPASGGSGGTPPAQTPPKSSP